ncbi:MAG: hypothetical protein L3J52_04295, partial [Proteobacteria bacterium]|nr:hypothetical protein [Pseudomonadota bacterium]
MNKSILFFLIIMVLLTLIVFNNESMPSKSYEVKIEKNDTDRSQCNYKHPKADEMIKTSFGNYVLQYPCTAEPKSLTYRHYNKKLDKYDLKLFLSYGDKKVSIWVQNSEKNPEAEHNFTARLSIGAKGIQTPAENVRTDNIEKIKVIESVGLDIYAKKRRVMGQ